MLEKIKKMMGMASKEDGSAVNAKKQAVIDNMPLCLDDPNVLLEHAVDESEIDRDNSTRTRGFLMRPGLIQKPAPKPQPDPTPTPTPTTATPTGTELMVVDVIRKSFGKHDVLGEFYINGEFQCYTLEDEKREEKVYGETCIDAGTYNITLRNEGGKTATYWQKYPDIHKGMLWIRNVPKFEYIYIHKGNHDDHTFGCILVGAELDPASKDKLDQKRRIIFSENAYLKIYPPIANHIAAGKQAVIRITEQPA